MVTRLEIVLRYQKKTTVRTAKNMDTFLNNVTSRRGMGKKECAVTRRFAKKRSSGINKKTTKKNKWKC